MSRVGASTLRRCSALALVLLASCIGGFGPDSDKSKSPPALIPSATPVGDPTGEPKSALIGPDGGTIPRPTAVSSSPYRPGPFPAPPPSR